MIKTKTEVNMRKIDKEEMFGNLKDFLKSKGIELQEGSYTQRIRQGCGILTESVNLSQEALARTKTAMDKRLGQLRQVIHEQTAPKPPPPGTQAANAPAQGGGADREEPTTGKAVAAKARAKSAKRRAEKKSVK
jgi:hypothetical protein